MKPETWTTSSRSGGNGCLQTRWTKSSRSDTGGTCIETRQHETVQLRDSKLADASPVLSFTPTAWTAFIDAVTTGEIAP